MSIWSIIALSLSVLAVVASAYGWWHFAQLEKRRDKLMALHLDQLQQQLSMLQRDMEQLAKNKPSFKPSAKGEDLSATPYNQAIELVKHGLSAAEVAERCGISRSEAELIVSLYRNNSTS
ncbi:DUF2802 domain-containing protein [Pseudogulbenkiania sp. MAI-1]|uniref:DUF2802 domain-containing protein n=1 Tax=Pseudogulbenkiania sp. MAI-1 TaxID=990370 RepID=UPI0012EB32D6|nr:DUF2802 domain-containing protein [Pseudogulbenkiania sp. MAI-1]